MQSKSGVGRQELRIAESSSEILNVISNHKLF